VLEPEAGLGFWPEPHPGVGAALASPVGQAGSTFALSPESATPPRLSAPPATGGCTSIAIVGCTPAPSDSTCRIRAGVGRAFGSFIMHAVTSCARVPVRPDRSGSPFITRSIVSMVPPSPKGEVAVAA
jgi:hypothetical protein